MAMTATQCKQGRSLRSRRQGLGENFISVPLSSGDARFARGEPQRANTFKDTFHLINYAFVISLFRIRPATEATHLPIASRDRAGLYFSFANVRLSRGNTKHAWACNEAIRSRPGPANEAAQEEIRMQCERTILTGRESIDSIYSK